MMILIGMGDAESVRREAPWQPQNSKKSRIDFDCQPTGL